MRRTLRAVAGLCVLMGTLSLTSGAVGAQACGGYFGPPCGTETLTFEYPRTVQASQSIKITGIIETVEAAAKASADTVDFVLADQAIGSAPVNADGTFSGTFTVPSVAPAEYDITATSGTLTTTGPITVIASGDLDCGDITGTTLISGDDPHGLDGDGDGVGCEGNVGSAGGNPLARTGLDATPMVTLGAAGLILGAAAVYGSRRRRLG